MPKENDLVYCTGQREWFVVKEMDATGYWVKFTNGGYDYASNVQTEQQFIERFQQGIEKLALKKAEINANTTKS